MRGERAYVLHDTKRGWRLCAVVGSATDERWFDFYREGRLYSVPPGTWAATRPEAEAILRRTLQREASVLKQRLGRLRRRIDALPRPS